MVRLQLLVAIALLAHAAVTTQLWDSIALTFSVGSYSQKRVELAFHGIDVDRLARTLDASLPSSQPVALAPELARDAFVYQRLSEALYPRRLEPQSPSVIDYKLLAAGAGPGVSEPPAAAFSVLRALDASLALAALAAAGWLALLRATPRFGPERWPASAAAALLLAIVLVALKTTLQSWLQVGWRGFFPGFGATAAIAVAIALRWRPRLRQVTRLVTDKPERLVLAAYLTLALVRAPSEPITLWDGRSIWFFNAHRVFEHGMLSVADLTRASTLWSHPDYPLLYPAVTSFFSSAMPAFSERMAALGIVALITAISGLLWSLARVSLGRACGALLTVAMLLYFDWLTFGGYADALLAQLLAIEMLAFTTGGAPRIGWIAAACASLLKPEGLVLGAAVAAACNLRELLSRPWPLVVFLPAVGHRAWLSLHGVDTVIRGAPAAMVERFLPRLLEAFRSTPILFEREFHTGLQPGVQPLLRSGLVALMVTVALAARLGRRARIALPAVACGLLCVAFGYVAIAALPEPVPWLVANSLDRLFMHSAVLFLIASLLLAGGVQPDRPRRSATRTERLAAEPH